MAWMMDTYSQEQGYAMPGVVTGKPIELGGSLGRNGATGLGVVFVAEKAFEKKSKSMKGATIAVQGFGNVGSHAALYAWERGSKIVALSDVSGGVYNGDGFNIPEVMEYVKLNKTLAGLPKSQKITNDDLLFMEVDCLMPCALENQITEANAEKIRAKMIIEGANGPVTNTATKILHKKGIYVVPDVIANGGGVVVSYFEWVQDIMSFFWEEDEINNRLKSIITKAFDKCYTMGQEKNVDLRSAAVAVGVQRLEKAMLLRGLYPR
jgi:glutamate dehydrogenase (NAD(P)+)